MAEREHVQRIDLERVASVQARLPACPACGGRLAKHCARYEDANKAGAAWFAGWRHSWRCPECGKATGEFLIKTWEEMLEFNADEDIYIENDKALDERDDMDARYFL